MVRYLLLVFLFCNSAISLGIEVSHEISEEYLVVGKPFELTFRIKEIDDSVPTIQFKPSSNLEIIERKKHDVSINSKVINGQIITRRDAIVKYLIVPNRSGTSSLRKIVILVDGETIKYKNININVLKIKPKPKKIFIEAEVDKKSVFVGEGINVNYYLYNSVPVTLYDIKKFPKFNRFLKKNKNVNDQGKTIGINGVVYRKTLKYAVKVFPQVARQLTINSLRMSIRYRDVANRYGLARFKEKTTSASSKPVKISVKSLPEKGLPTDFTGLVGNYNFVLEVPKTKLLINDPVDVKLRVTGDGMLDTYEPPIIYEHKELESFDVTSESFDKAQNRVERVFTQTYLARGEMTIDKRVLSQSYFDPTKEKYVTVNIDVPRLQSIGGVVGKSSAGVASDRPVSAEITKRKKDVPLPLEKKAAKLFGPIFENWDYHGIDLVGIILVILGMLFMILFFPILKAKKRTVALSKEVAGLNNSLKKDGFNYPVLHKLIFHVNGSERFTAPDQVIVDLSISKDAKRYFMELLKKSESDHCGVVRDKTKSKYVYKAKFFNELITYTKNYENSCRK